VLRGQSGQADHWAHRPNPIQEDQVLHKLRRRIQDEKGFTLIELLVVILIIGILAAIAIPSFINQRGKANDAATKSMARTAQTAIETYATDNGGDYTGATATALNGIEPTIPTANTTNNYVTVSGTGTNTYTVTSTQTTGAARSFSITRNSNGTFTRSCAPSGGGCVNSSW
jgi:type IV pilus assembly protein PilA